MALICLVCGRHKCDDVEPVYGITYYENGSRKVCTFFFQNNEYNNLYFFVILET